MPTRAVHLDDQADAYVQDGISAGRFQDADQAVTAGLHLLQRRDEEDAAKLAWLRNAAQEAFQALDRGEGIELRSADDITQYVASAVAEMSEPGMSSDPAHD